jgi:hypothetical protein
VCFGAVFGANISYGKVGVAEAGSRARREVAARTRWATSHGVGLGLLLVLTVWLGISLWVAPVQADGAALRAAADAGQIINLNREGAPPSPLSREPLFLFGHDDSTDSSGAFLVWTTRNGHRYYTDATTAPGLFPNHGGTTSGSMLSGDGSNPSPVDRVTSYVLERTRFQGGFVWAGIAQLALVVCAIGSIRGRPPLRGTRWFWFWVISLPLGVGVLWFALSELLRDPAPTPARVRERWNGGQGFALSVVGPPVIQLTVVAGQLLFTRM